ncbi:hypothetical protein OEZ85_000431 [Tetradesmus obliquus]|uniref:UBC core domain-containing protein n=1 Tax=Tetradesmus obliquus TaxID=3088 RepID=A0ABY8USX0_TETOB|nr:hypothetical protein OEZ85_000431 [Tetradesmus obliquus]
MGQPRSSSSSSSSSSSKPVAAVSLLPPAPEDRAVLRRHALKLMLYQRPSSGSRAAPPPLGLANAAAAAAAAAGNGDSNAGIRHVLQVIRCLLTEPYPESALNEEAGKALLEDYAEHVKYARLMTSLHAQQPAAAKRHMPLTTSDRRQRTQQRSRRGWAQRASGVHNVCGWQPPKPPGRTSHTVGRQSATKITHRQTRVLKPERSPGGVG